MKFDFDDILLTPSVISTINSRKEINPYDEHGMLPIMTAPMDTVVSAENFYTFIDNKIYGIYHRGIKNISYSSWRAVGLEEFKHDFITNDVFELFPMAGDKAFALIDVANGHMLQLVELVEEAKNKYGDKLVLMVGNIANPKTFGVLSRVGADYIRVGIGGGQGCLTSVQCGIGYPMASLIKECADLKFSEKLQSKIVADGGFKKFSDINKALALGADYVMLGSMLNKCLESSGDLYKDYKLHGITKMKSYFEEDELGKKRYINEIKTGVLFKSYRGMSTKEVQKDWGKTELKTAEGISRYNTVEYTLSGFVENLEDYLRSAMSYTSSATLEDFRESLFTQITPASFNRFNK